MDELSKAEGRVGKTLASFKDSGLDELVRKFNEDLLKPSLPHMAAIHGALVAQEIVKFITKRDIPLVNQIIINPKDSGCLVIKTPTSLGSRVISDDAEKEEEVEIVAAANTLD